MQARPSIMTSRAAAHAPSSSIALKATQTYVDTFQSQPAEPRYPLNPTTRIIYSQLIDLCLLSGYTHDQVLTPCHHLYELAFMLVHVLESWSRKPPKDCPEVMAMLRAGGEAEVMGTERMRLIGEYQMLLHRRRNSARGYPDDERLGDESKYKKSLAELDRINPLPLIVQRRPRPPEQPKLELLTSLPAKTEASKVPLTVVEIQELVNQFHGIQTKSKVMKGTGVNGTTVISSSSSPSSVIASAAASSSSSGSSGMASSAGAGKKRRLKETTAQVDSVSDIVDLTASPRKSRKTSTNSRPDTRTIDSVSMELVSKSTVTELKHALTAAGLTYQEETSLDELIKLLIKKSSTF